MKTANPIERYIKKQIDEREIAPSRDLWSEIESKTVHRSPKKSKFNLTLLAACFVLISGVGAVLFFNTEERKSGVPIAETVKIIPAKKENSVQPEKINPQAVIINEQEKLSGIKNISPESQIGKEIPLKNDMPLIKESTPELVSPVIQNQPLKMIAKTDSVKIHKKKRYVDPSTLLFSVEYKEVIEKSKDGSNVATIDLNTK
jgi:hypothetical protein